MTTTELQALQNAAASSAMEGLPLSQVDMELIQSILDGKSTLQDFLSTMKTTYGSAQ